MEQEKLKQMEEIFDNLTEENKDILLMVANGMKLGQKYKLEVIQENE